jgi:hypothetical protein
MLVEAKQLRWMGIDLCSRRRRRVAVAATYAAFLVAVWLHPPRTYEVEMLLWFAMLTRGIGPAIEEAWGKWTRRIVATSALLCVEWLYLVWGHPRHTNPMGLEGPMFAVALLSLGTVLGTGRLVGTAYAGWMANAMRKGARLSWRGQQRLARKGFLFGLEGFAWNEYGVRFKELNDEQKRAVEQMRRTNPHGRWMSGMERKLVDDERLRQEDNQVRAQVQRTLTVVLLVSALGWNWALVEGWTIGAEVMVQWAWALFGLAITLRTAIVLWTEDDPRMVSDELEMVQGQET